ncbi:acetate--CoA ligase family protein [Antarcticirhabdus aurantiaca]|uniref:Acetate--CoA ligase family protein n=1 Tax=Antarcticirhabdus aurantiaca TaxID=2606717 RepID=A0ACD4NMA5_9HYPH|nr:acetate--CoA ligase family protein [Antarcticirhabdus aurantiaca]WAJ28060.1 acetate--CoA ligase family protein [Jeongeuplla avenae]
MTKGSLSRVLRPRSIAVFGGGWSNAVLKQCRAFGFEGDLWPVHPSRAEVEGLSCFRSVADLPGVPDLSFIGVNRDATIDIVRELSARGAGGAVCFASGFSEVADGAARNAALLSAAGDMPILGPNCYGFINYLDGALLWPDQHGGRRVERGAALVVQSSNIAINLTMQKRGLPIAYVLTAGNQAQTGLSELVEAALDDERVSVLGLHIEGFDDLHRLEGAFRKARERRVPVVVIKVGTSAAAQAMALSHTASLAGADRLADAFFERCGVARARSIDEFVETLKLLHVLGPSPDATLGSMSCSGGEASLVGDLAEAAGLDLRALDEREATALRATLPDMVTISNPLDYHTFTWNDPPALARTYRAMLDGGFGLTILVLDQPRPDRCADNGSAGALQAAIDAHGTGGGRFALVSSLPENMSEAEADRLVEAGIAPLMGLSTALLAAAHAARIGAAWAGPPAPPLARQAAPAGAEARARDEWASKAILSEIGIETPAGGVARSADEAVRLAERIGFPVVVKGVGEALLHKTEAAAVKLDLRDAAAVRGATASLAHLGCDVLVERMVTGGLAELILGIARDPQFGLFLTIGAGGVAVELWNDTRPLLLPADREAIRAAILSLKSAPLLLGFRGRPAANLDAIVEAAFRLGEYALAEAHSLEELDVNPLIATAEAAIAADALIRARRSP